MGIKREQVNTLRFECNESFGENKYFMHFKINNNDVIESSFSGDQSSLSPNSWKAGYHSLDKPSGWDHFKDRMGRIQVKSLDFANKTNTGGLAVTPFGSKKFGSFWTVVGDDPRNPIFECGSYHRDVMDAVGANSPAMARTHHTVYFRGKAPSADEVRQRMLAKINRRANTA